MARPDLNPALAFLRVPTPAAWFERAREQIPTLLMDHANCEKKAASTALSMTYRYVQHPPLLHKMSQLAREEMRHFEMVLELMEAEGIVYEQLSSARYAQALHQHIRKQEPYRLIDTLLVGAIVEARSCERFVGLIEVLPERIAHLYRTLVHSEARHFGEYLALARNIAAAHDLDEEVDRRVDDLLDEEATLVTTPDATFRFHSGAPD
ncbi:MAG: tRNA-(ms[2]io[6]A)-hydroxylase [Pseudomonadota bacterium]